MSSETSEILLPSLVGLPEPVVVAFLGVDSLELVEADGVLLSQEI